MSTRRAVYNRAHILTDLTVAIFICGLLGLVPQWLSAQTASTITGTFTDSQGLPISGAEAKLNGPTLGIDQKVSADADGTYRFVGLPAGKYTLVASHQGFATKRFEGVELFLNRTLVFNIVLQVGTLQQTVAVEAAIPLVDTTDPTSGDTITPRQILETPLNGRNYLDLMQLVPGVTINRQADEGSDTAAPILGERGGNAIFLIDGLPNRNEVDGGPAAQFNQDTIYEFQVLTTGFKAEFGHGSGGIVNVITKSGGDQWHASTFLFHRNSAFDSSDVPNTGAPSLLRWDYGAVVGGQIVKDRVFFFGSAERIWEARQLNFVFAPSVPQFLKDTENGFNKKNRTFNTRTFARLDEHLGRNRLSEELNLTNNHITDFLPLSLATNLPSTRTDEDSRNLMLGLRDVALLGDQGNPFVLSFYVQYRGEPSGFRPAHPESGAQVTDWAIFSGFDTGLLIGDLGDFSFGGGATPSTIFQKYISTGVSAAKHRGRHDVKFGADYIRTQIDGVETNNLSNILFATVDDFVKYGPIDAGFYTLRSFAGLTPADNLIRLRNNYFGPFVQDDWKIAKTLTVNLGLRWDYDSRFPNNTNFSPRLGFAWSVTSKTVIHGSWGLFYDHFRIGVGRDVPAFGGASITFSQPFSYPRLFYGVPTIAPILEGLCLSPSKTDAQIAASGATCPFGPLPYYGVDHLNDVVAPGHAPIPANSVVTMNNAQSLTGLTPQQFLDQASMAVGQNPGYFFWGGFGNLSQQFGTSTLYPVQVDPSFATPYTRSFNLGVERQIGTDWVIGLDYYHKDILNILGIRATNLAFEARMPGHNGEIKPGTGVQPINGIGPWDEGTYDGLIVSFKKRFSKRFLLAGDYTFAHAIDNTLCSNFVSNSLAGHSFFCLPSDSFVGIPPVVTDAVSGKTNADGPFIASNGNPVQQAGKFYNGANVDKGASDLALDHTFLLNGVVDLPWRFQVSSIFRMQSGFHFSRGSQVAQDLDGDGYYTGLDVLGGIRNAFQAPKYVNTDIRVSKRFQIGEHLRITTLFELFNLFNNHNPAAVEQVVGRPTPYGQPLQVLPGREGQVGLRIEY